MALDALRCGPVGGLGALNKELYAPGQRRVTAKCDLTDEVCCQLTRRVHRTTTPHGSSLNRNDHSSARTRTVK